MCLPKACVGHFSKVSLAPGSTAPPSDSHQLLQGLWGHCLLGPVVASGPARKRLLSSHNGCTSAQCRGDVNAFLSCLSVTVLSQQVYRHAEVTQNVLTCLGDYYRFVIPVFGYRG